MTNEIISQIKEVNEVLVDAVFHDREEVVQIFNELGYHCKNTRQVLLSFNTIVTEIPYHQSQENDDMAAELVEMIGRLHRKIIK